MMKEVADARCHRSLDPTIIYRKVGRSRPMAMAVPLLIQQVATGKD
jgi:hypothetical protein